MKLFHQTRSGGGRARAPLAALLALSACDASFSYERLGQPTADLASARPGDGGADGAIPGGDGPAADLAGTGAQVLARGTFSGRAGHGAAGSALLVRGADGGVTVQLSADFRVDGVPGPYLYLSSRADLGRSLDAQADLQIAALQQLSGAQSYAVPAGAEQQPFLWVWCKPFGVEVARAPLAAP